jgi:hypothetical protein
MTQTLVLVGSGSGTLPAGTTTIEIEEVGGGGGGGGAGSSVNVQNLLTPTTLMGGGGGSSGVYRRRQIVVGTDLTYNWTCGAGGAGGFAQGGSGLPGGTTSLTIGGTTYSVSGGSGGFAPVEGTVVNDTIMSTAAQGAATVANPPVSLGDIVLQEPGGNGTSVAGRGGSTPLGSGGFGGATVASNGFVGTGYGGGGGGALGSALQPKLGGAGSPGAILLTPFP